jgi:bacillithiol biosynthesis cysteine-adding enzyme BshC
LYFFYKIIHAIQLAADLKLKYPSYNFVPVYYMGSEDADIEEVGGFVLGGAKHQWVTKQTGAIGRMKVDDNLIGLLQNLEGYWSVKPNGSEILALLKKAYQKGKTINDATLELVNGLFGEKGLVVIQPDDAALKSLFIPVMEKELKSQFSHAAVQSTLQKLEAEYHVQSAGRYINLFYLQDQQRLRIEKEGELFKVVDTDLSFSEAAIINELKAHPEKFSPNVILRGVYQETILPGIVFIGGGGELAYWMELANVFEQAAVPYPVLQLRNSFAFIRPKQIAKWNELGLSLKDLFKPILAIEVLYVQQEAKDALHLNLELAQLRELYNDIKVAVMKVDPTLGDHTQNLAHQSEKKLQELEKKMIRAERRKQATQIERIHAIKNSLFPAGSLQERVENMAEWVGDYDIAWIEAIFEYSNTMEQNFTVITITE